MQFEEAESISFAECLLAVLPVTLAAFAYPLGNRMMIKVCDNKLNTIDRVFGMTLCSIPFWLILSTFGITSIGLPSTGQIIQSLIVSIFSGVIATVLFFKATDLVSSNPYNLAIIESTQAGEVIFTVLGSVLILKEAIPSPIAILGLILIIIGMILNSLSN